jgi:hypothetical protein
MYISIAVTNVSSFCGSKLSNLKNGKQSRENCGKGSCRVPVSMEREVGEAQE